VGWIDSKQAIDAAMAGEDPMEAKIVRDHIAIRTDYHLADCRVLETDCSDYDTFVALPRVVERDGVKFGLTGWNSDRGTAYYKNWIALAKVVIR
jgi:hypothetical protein